MSVGHDDQPETASVPKVVTSVPWVVVLLGVGLLTTLLLFTLLTLRGPERQAAPPPAPPMYLPTIAATTPSATPSDAPLVAADTTASPTPSSSESPSPKASSPVPSTSRTAAAPAAPRTGTVSARYQVTRSERDFFDARLTITNGSARSQDWRVELLFTGNVKSIQASSASGVAVSNQGSGVFVLRSTSPLGSGGTATVQMRFSRTGAGDQPGQCTVNGAACAIG
ncbi:MAG: cellulose binding domain-containing protein [Micromonospora sp.]